MKLKTLNDIGGDLVICTHCNNFGDLFVNMKELKQEAIKWVKYWEEEIKTAKTNYYCELVGQVREFMSFFNITEEELK